MHLVIPGGSGAGSKFASTVVLISLKDNDDFDVRHARFERPNELRAKIDFADADGMQPEHMTVGEPLHEIPVIVSKPLEKS